MQQPRHVADRKPASEAWTRSVDFDASRLEVGGKGDRERIERRLRPAVGSEHRAVRVQCQ